MKQPSGDVSADRKSSRSKSKRHQQRSRVVTTTDSFRFAEIKDPSVFAHLLADHFVAREVNNATFASPPLPQFARPVAGSVTLGSFRSWQFGERCLATYRVLFGRPLWTNTNATPSSVTRKRKHVTPPTTGSSSEGSDGGNIEQSETELLTLPTVEELLELPTEEEQAVGDVLASLGLDDGVADDAIDLLWDFDTSEGVIEEELRFLDTANTFPDEMDDI